MFEFRWDLPSSTPSHQVRLQIHARHGWVGRKTLQVDGRTEYRRGWFAGIDHTFAHPEHPGGALELRAVEDLRSRTWVPTLYCDGALLPETTHTDPPPVPDRPKTVSIVVGVTYLAMFLLVVMLQHIPKMLNAVRGHHDVRTYVLEVVRPGLGPDGLRLHRSQPPRATLNEPYEARITPQGGTPPYLWERIAGRMPPGLTLDEATGVIRGTPAERGDRTIRMRVTDTARARAEWWYVISVEGPRPGYPRIETQTLPSARHGEAYQARLAVAQGQPPYHWVVNTRKLPKGLKFAVDSEAGEAPGAVAWLMGAPRMETTLLFSAKADNTLEGDLDRAALPSGLADTFAKEEIPLSQGASVLVEDPGRRWLIVDDRQCYAIAKHKDEATLDVYDTAGAYALEFRVTDAAYSPSGDIWPWAVPFAATAICLLGFWNMRRWSVPLYGGLIILQAVLALAIAGFPLSVTAVVLQALVWGVGAGYWPRMH